MLDEINVDAVSKKYTNVTMPISTWIGSAAAAMAGVLVLRQRLSGNKGALIIDVSQSKRKMENQHIIVMQELYQNQTWQGRQRQRAETSSSVCKYHNIDDHDTTGALQT